MKKYFVLFLITMMFISCSKEFLDINPKGALYPQSFYSNETDLDMAIVGLYKRAADCYHFGYAISYTMGAPDKTSKFVNFEEVDIFATEGDNGEMMNFWSKSWQVIAAANEIIARYNDATASEVKKREVAGQAHFIRAYQYFMLVRQYNKIPLFTNAIEVSWDISVSNPEDVYELIVNDLLIAEQYLPDNWDHDEKLKSVGWTSGAAKSLLAYVYLSMAGYPLNDVSKYSLAAQKAKEVIDSEARYGYRLMDNIDDLYSKEYNWQNNVCDEVVLAFNPDQYWGCPLCGFPSDYGGWDVYYSEINFYETYPDGPRKDAIFWGEFLFPSGMKNYSETNTKHPFFKQYWDGWLDWNQPWNGMDWTSHRPQVAITHAHNLLVYAEAQAMSASPDASAYDAINRVRRRAGLDNLPTGLSQTAFRDAVVQERLWEFCGGYFCTSPWYDLVRLERVETSINDRHPEENPILKVPTKEDYFAPYPTEDVIKNPNLVN